MNEKGVKQQKQLIREGKRMEEGVVSVTVALLPHDFGSLYFFAFPIVVGFLLFTPLDPSPPLLIFPVSYSCQKSGKYMRL